MPPAPTVFESADSFSGTSEGVRLKVMRISYVQGITANAEGAIEATLSYWKQLAEGGNVNTQIQPRAVSGIEGKAVEATFTAQGQIYRGQILALAQDRTLWQFITVYPDSPFGRTLIQRALSSVKLPANCG